jgi:hypothetical protein
MLEPNSRTRKTTTDSQNILSKSMLTIWLSSFTQRETLDAAHYWKLLPLCKWDDGWWLGLESVSIVNSSTIRPIVIPSIIRPVINPSSMRPIVKSCTISPMVNSYIVHPIINPSTIRPMVNPSTIRSIVNPSTIRQVDSLLSENDCPFI